MKNIEAAIKQVIDYMRSQKTGGMNEAAPPDDESAEAAPDDEVAEGETPESIHADTMGKIGEILKGHNAAHDRLREIQSKADAAKADAKKMRAAGD